jgi:hypothetical protein
MRNEFSHPTYKLAASFAIKKQGGALKLLGLSEDGGRAKFAENFRASPFNKDLSNETTFSLIHLAGQYL